MAAPSDKTKRVLVADDDDATRGALVCALRGRGYEVVESGDGAEVLEILCLALDGAARLPDLMLLDFCMPGFSGIGILRALRGLGRLPPTFIISAFPDPALERLAQSAGARSLFRKPIELRDLLDAVERALAVAETGRHEPC